MDNSFEKQIRDKVNQAEVTPADGLLDAIFEKRATKPKPFMGLGYTKLFLLTALVVVTVGVWVLNTGDSGTKPAPLAGQNSSASDAAIQLPAASASEKDQVSEKSLTSETPDKFAQKRDHVANSEHLKSKKLRKHSNVSQNLANTVKNGRSEKAINKIQSIVNPSKNWNTSDPNAYFNVDAAGRPTIDYETHNGNSHLFVYESVDPAMLESSILRYTGTSNIQKVKYPFVFDAMSPIKTSKNQYAVNDKHQRPLFIDLLYSAVYTNTKTSDAAINTLKNGTFNQQYSLRVTAPIKGKISAFAGLGYMNQISHYRGDLPYSEAFTNITTKVSFINDPIKGVIRVETKDTVSGIAARTKALDFRNTYSLFRLPIGLGYSFGLGQFDFTLYGSADVTLLSYSGVHTKLTEAVISKSESNSKSLHMGAGFSFMSAYRISPRFRLIAEPGVHYIQLKGAQTGNIFNEKIYNFTGSIGLRYSIF